MPAEPKTLLTTSRFKVVEHLVETESGQPAVTRQVVVHPGAVTIIPLLEGNRVCLIRNYRVAVDKTLIELPAGTIDLPESPMVTAVRELKEETGYTAARWRELPHCFMSPGILDERMHFYAAEQLTSGAPAREAGEQIENLIVSFQEALAMIDRQEIEDGKTIATLLTAARRRQQG